MSTIEFDAFDYQADQSFRSAHYRFEGSTEEGWQIARDGVGRAAARSRLPRPARAAVRGVLDRSRAALPAVPVAAGHRPTKWSPATNRATVTSSRSTRRNRARGMAGECAFCAAGLPTHCPDRVTLGIDALARRLRAVDPCAGRRVPAGAARSPGP